MTFAHFSKDTTGLVAQFALRQTFGFGLGNTHNLSVAPVRRVDLARTSAEGVAHLKDYLMHAEKREAVGATQQIDDYNL
nr:hypothetical protein GCM10023233_18220 [Brevibacterium otitidis]